MVINEIKPAREKLFAGPLQVTLEDGMLIYIKFGNKEVVRGIYAAVRDKNWGTLVPRFLSYDVVKNERSFLVKFTAEHKNSEIHYIWDGIIEGYENGTIRFRMNGTAKNTFLKNRIGFCVLHPLDLAGVNVKIETENGIVEGEFPKRISPHQPFFDMVSIQHPVVPGVEAEIRFEGDLFEMEDQRNWTDASYKTYCTPLRIPYPAEIRAGQKVNQSVTIRLLGNSSSEASGIKEKSPKITISTISVSKIPEIGVGLAKGQLHSISQIEALRELRLKNLFIEFDVTSEDWHALLSQATNYAKSLGTLLELSAMVEDDGESLKELLQFILQNHIPVSRLGLYPKTGFTTTRSIVTVAKEIQKDIGLSIPIVGGSRAYFAQMNRANLPIDLIDGAVYSINPQVHAFDNMSITETIATQPVTVETARLIVGNIPIVVGPITLKPRFNPDATGPVQESSIQRSDPRQKSLFAAGWTIGSINGLASAGVAALTYYETVGPCGLMEDDNLFPLYHIIADVTEIGEANVLNIETNAPLTVQAIALQKESLLRVVVANVTDEKQSIVLQTPEFLEASIRFLDETTLKQAATKISKFRERIDKVINEKGSLLTLDLQAYGIAKVDLWLG